MLIVVSAIGVLSVLAEETPTSENFLDRVRSDFDLVWSDEFNGDTLDTTKWKLDGQLTRRNSELQIYADSMEDGNLQFDGQSAIIVPKIESRVALDGRKYKYKQHIPQRGGVLFPAVRPVAPCVGPQMVVCGECRNMPVLRPGVFI